MLPCIIKGCPRPSDDIVVNGVRVHTYCVEHEEERCRLRRRVVNCVPYAKRGYSEFMRRPRMKPRHQYPKNLAPSAALDPSPCMYHGCRSLLASEYIADARTVVLCPDHIARYEDLCIAVNKKRPYAHYHYKEFWKYLQLRLEAQDVAEGRVEAG